MVNKFYWLQFEEVIDCDFINSPTNGMVLSRLRQVLKSESLNFGTINYYFL